MAGKVINLQITSAFQTEFCNINSLGKNVRSKCKIFKCLGATT